MDNSNETDVSLPFMQSCSSPVVCIVEVTVVIAVTFLILTGNTVNLIILVSTPKLRNSHGYLLMSLSVADLMMGMMAALAVYPSATLQASPDSWPYGDTTCLIVAYVSQVGITNSGATLLLLSIERYIAVAHPLRYSRVVTRKATLVCIAVVWLVSAGVFSTIFAGFPEHLYFSSLYVCLPQFFGSPIVWLFLAFVLAPVLIIMVTSCIVSRKLQTGPGAAAHVTDSGSRTKIKVKTFRMVQVMTATYMLCYIPFYATSFVGLLARVSLPQVLLFGVYWLLLANSFFNTLIYFRMNAAYGKRLHELLNSVTSAVSLTLMKGSEKTESNSTKVSAIDLEKPADSASINIQCHDSAV